MSLLILVQLLYVSLGFIMKMNISSPWLWARESIALGMPMNRAMPSAVCDNVHER